MAKFTVTATNPQDGKNYDIDFEYEGEGQPSENIAMKAAEQAFGVSSQVEQASIQPTDESFGTRLSKDLEKRGQMAKENIKTLETPLTPAGKFMSDKVPGYNLPAQVLGVAGQIAGGVVDLGTQLGKSAYETLVPESYKKDINTLKGHYKAEFINSPEGQKAIELFKEGGKVWQSFKKDNPGAAVAVESAANIWMAKGMVPSIKEMAKPIGNLTNKVLTNNKADTLIKRELQKKTGINYPIGMETGNKGLEQAERALGQIPTSSGIMKRQYDNTLNQVKGFQESILPTKGGTIANEGGQEALRSFELRNKSHKNIVSKAYDAVFDEMPKGEPIPITMTSQLASDMADELSQGRLGGGKALEVSNKLVEPSGLLDVGFPEKIKNKVVGQAPFWPAYKITEPITVKGKPSQWKPFQDTTWVGIKKDREILGDMINEAERGGQDGLKRRLIQLKTTLDTDLEAFAESQGSTFYDKYKFANELNRAGIGGLPGKNIFKNKQVLNAIDSAMKKDPSAVIDMVFRKDNLVLADNFKKAVSPHAWSQMQDGWIERMFRTQEGEFSPINFYKKWSEIDTPTKKVLTSGRPDYFKKLDDLSLVGKHISEYEAVAGNATRNSGGIGTIGQYTMAASSLMSGNFIMAATSLLAPVGAAKLLTGSVAKLLRNGIKYAPSSPQSRGYALQALIASGMTRNSAIQALDAKMQEMTNSE